MQKNKYVALGMSIFLIFVALATVNGLIPDGYELVTNLTFNNLSIGVGNQSGGVFVLSTTNCVSGECLERTGTDSDRFFFIDNSSFFVDLNSGLNYIWQGWIKDIHGGAADTAVQSAIYFLQNNQNFNYLGLDTVNSGSGIFNGTFISGTKKQTLLNFSGAPTDLKNRWVWAKITMLTNGTTSFEFFRNSTEDTVIKGYDMVVNNPYNDGLVGFWSFRQAMWDDWELLRTSVVELTLNSNLFGLNGTENFNDATLQVTYNGTLAPANTIDIFNCSLLAPDGISINITNNDVNLSEGFNQNFTYNTPNSFEGLLNFSISCENFETSDQIGIFNINTDTVEPIIVSNFINNSIYIEGNILNLTVAQFNFSDKNLFATNLTIFDSLGNVFDSQNFFTENITTGFNQVNLNTTLSTEGSFNILGEAWDSHNPINKPVKPLQWSVENNNLFAEDLVISGDIKFYNNQNDLVTYFYLDENRHKFKVTFNEDSLTHQLNISASNWLLVTEPYLHYTTWLINLETKRYFDFDSQNVENIVITKNSGLYIVDITLKTESDEIEFESIGDLNFVNKGWSFSVIAIPPAPSNETQLNLTGIENAINNLVGSFDIFGFLVLALIFIFAGVFTRFIWMWFFASGTFFLMAMSFFQRLNLEPNNILFQWAGITLIFIAIGFISATVIVYIAQVMEQDSKQKKETDFYQSRGF